MAHYGVEPAPRQRPAGMKIHASTDFWYSASTVPTPIRKFGTDPR